MRGDRERLTDIVEAIERIERYSKRGKTSFESDELIQAWMVHHIEIVGEAARGVSDPLRKRHPDVPWQQIVAMRNVLAHGYFGIDVELVWATVHRELPVLRVQIQAILDGMEPDR